MLEGTKYAIMHLFQIKVSPIKLIKRSLYTNQNS